MLICENFWSSFLFLPVVFAQVWIGRVPPPLLDASVRILDRGANASYVTANPGMGWQEITFNDSSWTPETLPFGYEMSHPDVDVYINTLLAQRIASSWHRVKFNVSQEQLDLISVYGCRVDVASDNYANVFLNGGGVLNMDSRNFVSKDEDGDATYWDERWQIPPNRVIVGENVLAVRIVNTMGSSDTYFDCQISLDTVIVPLKSVGWFAEDIPTTAAWLNDSFNMNSWVGPFQLPIGRDRINTEVFRVTFPDPTAALRKVFFIEDAVLDLYHNFVAKVIFDSRAVVYINGAIVVNITDSISERAMYFNREVSVQLKSGNNVVAVELYSDPTVSSVYFDIEIVGLIPTPTTTTTTVLTTTTTITTTKTTAFATVAGSPDSTFLSNGLATPTLQQSLDSNAPTSNLFGHSLTSFVSSSPNDQQSSPSWMDDFPWLYVIIAGGAVVCCCVLLLVFCLIKRRGQKQTEWKTEVQMEPMHESPPTFPASEEVVPHEEPLRSNIYTSAAALQSNNTKHEIIYDKAVDLDALDEKYKSATFEENSPRIPPEHMKSAEFSPPSPLESPRDVGVMWIDDNGPALDETGDHPPQPLSRTLNLESDMVLDEADDVEDVNIVWAYSDDENDPWPAQPAQLEPESGREMSNIDQQLAAATTTQSRVSQTGSLGLVFSPVDEDE